MCHPDNNGNTALTIASGMRHLLHRLKFVDKKAKAVPGKANAELQRAYLAMLEKVLAEKDKHDVHYRCAPRKAEGRDA